MKSKDNTLNWFREGSARIIVATDAFSMGVDVKDVKKVIQWGVDEKLNLCTLVQRIGRAARTPDMLGVAIIYTPRNLLDPIPRDWEQPWSVPVNGGVVEETPASEQTTASEQTLASDQAGEWIDIDDNDESPDTGILANYRSRDLPKFSLPVLKSTQMQVDQLRRHMYQDAKNVNTAVDEQKKEQTGSLLPSNGDPGGRRKKPIDKIDPAVLWFLNTTGCRHRLILSYMAYPDVFDDHKQKSLCCDSCAVSEGCLPEATALGPGGKLVDSVIINLGPKSAPRKPTLLTPVCFTPEQFAQIESAIREEIHRWRDLMLQYFVGMKKLLPQGMPACIILPDPVLEAVVASANRVMTQEYLLSVLLKNKVHIGSGILKEDNVTYLLKRMQQVINTHKSRLGRNPAFTFH
jgi:hypothetical protein